MGTTPTPIADLKSYAAEDRLRLVINTIPALVVRALADGSVDFVNQRWLEYTGVSLENARRDGWLVAIHPEGAIGTLVGVAVLMGGISRIMIAAKIRRGVSGVESEIRAA
jgi:PAS domain-containing protein